MNNSIRNGTVSGTLLTIAGTINKDDIFKTMILAGIGAVVSFFVSVFLKWAIKGWKQRNNQSF